MGLISGLKKMDAHNDSRARRGSGSDGPKTEWFTLGDKESAKIQFLQELDDESPFYSKKNGVGGFLVEHPAPGPEGYKRKCQCTKDDEGRCFACEQYENFVDGWKRGTTKLYINVLVNPGTDDEKVVVLSQGVSEKSVTPTLLEYARENGSITNRLWKITRNGLKKETTWTIMAFDKDDKFKSEPLEKYELFDVSKVVREVPYDEQERFFGAAPAAEGEKPKSEESSSDFTKW